MPSLGIDKIVDSVLKIDDAADSYKEFRLQVLVDSSVEPSFIEYARKTLRPQSAQVTMNIGSYFDDPIEIEHAADLVIMLANKSKWTGSIAAIANAASTPVAIVAQNLDILVENAQKTGFPINPENIVAGEVLAQSAIPFGDAIDTAVDVAQDALTTVVDIFGNAIPAVITGKGLRECHKIDLGLPKLGTKLVTYEDMFEALGTWVMHHCPDIKAAFATAFPFARAAQVKNIAADTSFQNAVTGAIFFIPGADFPIMTLNELKMLVQIERAYGYSPDKQIVLEAAVVIICGFMAKCFASGMCKSFPMLKWVIKTGTALLTTLVMGHFMNAYCADGRDFPVKKIGSWQIVPDELAKPTQVDESDIAVPTDRYVVANVGH